MNSKNEAEFLLNETLPFAKKMLSKYGEFHPFGGYINSEGNVAHIGGIIENEPDYPKGSDLNKVIFDSLREKALTGKCSAGIIILNVEIIHPESKLKTNAIQANVDHKDDYSAEIFYPYILKDETIIYEKPFAQAGDSVLFKRGQ
jgi:hypothetical protein